MKPENNPPLDLASPPRKVKSFLKAEQLIFALSFAGDYRKIYCNNFYCNIIPISVLNWLNIFSSNPAGSSSKVKLVRKVPFNWMQISQPGKVCRWRRNVLLEEKDWNIVSKNTELVRWGGGGWFRILPLFIVSQVSGESLHWLHCGRYQGWRHITGFASG